MASIKLTDASVRFPFYDAWSRSFKHRFVNVTSFGGLLAEYKRKIHVDALSGVSLNISPGDRVAVLGGNGSGKTTLLRVLGGLITPNGGQAEIRGRAAAVLDIGFGFDPDASVCDTIVMQGILAGRKGREIRRSVEDISGFCGLADVLAHPIRNLPQGDIFRLGTGIAFFLGADIILYDEVMETVDPAFLAKIKDYIGQSLAADSIVVIVERSRAVLDGLCTKALVLEGGRVVEFDTFVRIMDRYGPAYTF